MKLLFSLCVCLMLAAPTWMAPSHNCVQKDCPVPRCVDSVLDRDKCCRICPNGRNCWSNGKLRDAVNQNVIRAVGSDCWALCRCPNAQAYEDEGTKTTAICRFWCRSGGGGYAGFLKKYYHSWG